ncbi:MAG: hypothetical protein ACUVRV_11940 [Cyanobacteriota bacterium]
MNFSGLIPALQANRVDFVMAGTPPPKNANKTLISRKSISLPKIQSSPKPLATSPPPI